MKSHKSNFNYFFEYLLIFIIGLVILLPFLGHVHLFDWDEANFAEAAREMLLTNEWLRITIDYMPFWEKPPLFIWLQAVSMYFFGINEFAARAPNAIAGAVTLCVLYYFGHKTANKPFAVIWVLAYMASWLPHFYFKSGIIDPIFNLFIFLNIGTLWMALKNKKKYLTIISGIFLGLAVLTKGPVALLIIALCFIGYFIWKPSERKALFYNVLICGFTSILITLSWFGLDIIQNGTWFTKAFINYQIRLFSTQDAGHGGFFLYHFVVLLLGCFPASIFWFQYKHKSKQNYTTIWDSDFTKWMYLLFWITLILFTIVKTKIIHYSSLCYFPLTYFGARELYLICFTKQPLKRLTKILGIGIIALIGLVLIALPAIGLNTSFLSRYINDEFTNGNLQAQVHWNYYEILIGILFIVVSIYLFIKLNTTKRKINLFLFLIFQMLFIEITVLHFTPKIEAYSQLAAINFYKLANRENAIIYPLNFKSYAYLFYSKKMKNDLPEVSDKINFLMQNPIQRKVYFVSKNIHEKEIMAKYNNLIVITRKNGYVLYLLQ